MESIVLGLFGGGLGVLLAVWASDLLERVPLPSQVPVAYDLSLDFRVLAFAFALAVTTGILFGLVPAAGQQAEPDPGAQGPGRWRTG